LGAHLEHEIPIAIAIHGGAGLSKRANLSAERQSTCEAGLSEAVTAGYEVLKRGGSALDAVIAAVISLEDCPLFNAGKGSVFSAKGRNEMDASIMDGTTREAGAIAGVLTPKNPILGARAVMDHSPHVFLSGPGADAFIASHGLEQAQPEYFRTEERWNQLLRARGNDQIALDHDTENVYGTVGAVALDQHGHLAAASSTGGMVNKRNGRLGDTPVIGAGTWADDRTCAVGATGHGEYFIRTHAAARVSNLMELGGYTLKEAAHRVACEEVPELGGAGGLICVDRDGQIAMPFSTGGMFRAAIHTDGRLELGVWP
jgi:beta-aspartyl-peptidase (threonine type)